MDGNDLHGKDPWLGHLGNSVGLVADSRSQLRSPSQGREFKLCIGLHAGRGAYLKK